SGHYAIPQVEMYKLTDLKGRLLAVKPDLTMPIARLAATRLKGHPLPLRLFYNQNIYRVSPALSGRSDEIDQIGIELIGSGTRRADLEVIVTAIEAMKHATKADFRLEIGHIGIFNALIRALELDNIRKEEIRCLIESKNYPALNDQLDRMKNREAALALRKLPALFGGEEVLEELCALTGLPEIDGVVAYLRSILKDLESLGLMDRVTLDLGIVNRNDYYTGIVFQGYLEGAGDIVLSGGRYDKLLSDYGVDLPAVGFGINVDSVAQAAKRELRFKLLPDVLIYAYPGYEVRAFKEIEKLVNLGFRAEFSVCETSEEAKTYAARKGIPTVYLVNDDIVEVRV
ncbi:MAG: ATP phosphoribosyltransferase regulatory subunit, partial [Oscillospiraceae bacterium]|nr:ATP phosphoribosyltransferase regulatory subunit [Oscillospiraceae bacterium]